MFLQNFLSNIFRSKLGFNKELTDSNQFVRFCCRLRKCKFVCVCVRDFACECMCACLLLVLVHASGIWPLSGLSVNVTIDNKHYCPLKINLKPVLAPQLSQQPPSNWNVKKLTKNKWKKLTKNNLKINKVYAYIPPGNCSNQIVRRVPKFEIQWSFSMI